MNCAQAPAGVKARRVSGLAMGARLLGGALVDRRASCEAWAVRRLLHGGKARRSGGRAAIDCAGERERHRKLEREKE